MDELVNLSQVYAVLEDLAHDIGEGYKGTLVADGHFTTVPSGDLKLLQSIKTRVAVGNGYYEVQMDLNDYWKYLENGTRPHWPPREAILNWIRIKPVVPRPNELGRTPTENQLAYLISRKIAKEGTKASHGLERTKEAVIGTYRDKLAAALGHDISDYIAKVMPH